MEILLDGFQIGVTPESVDDCIFGSAMMRAQSALGNRVAVKDQYETLRALLQKELGVEPAIQTQKAYKELLGA